MKVVASYIVSPQETHIDDVENKEIELRNCSTNSLEVIEPSWRDYIPMNQLRRMGKAVRIGTGAGLKLIKKHPKFENSDAIILTTSNGGLEDCIKFLKQIVFFGEGALTPTNFVQSTPNAIAGNIAMATSNQAYNMTHVNGSFSFVDGLRDAELFINDQPEAKILLGSVEEISDYNYRINELRGDYKTEKINSLDLISSNTKGTICGEGSAFFGLSNTEDGIEIVDAATLLSAEPNQIKKFINGFLSENKIEPKEIDTLMLGYNGDVSNREMYDYAKDALIPESNVFTFKELFGEHPSVISMGFWYATMLQKGMSPYREPLRDANKKIDTVLIFNQYNRNENSLVLIKK